MDVMTSDLPPRLAWGVGRLTKPQSLAGGVHRVASEIKSGGNNLRKNTDFLVIIFQVLLLNFITKLEKNQLDT